LIYLQGTVHKCEGEMMGFRRKKVWGGQMVTSRRSEFLAMQFKSLTPVGKCGGCRVDVGGVNPGEEMMGFRRKKDGGGGY
jgi:hypothetical protein